MDLFGTLGPACENAGVLCDMLRMGMTGIRLNLSHETLVSAAPRLQHLREAERLTGISAKLLVDMQGPELRIGDLPSPILLVEGRTVRLPDDIPMPRIVMKALSKRQEILLDDGKLLLMITEPGKAVVKRGGLLHSRKSIALPGKELNTPALTGEDLENISFFTEFGVTGVMQPFVRGGKDLIDLRKAMEQAGCGSLRIYAKIENRLGMDRLAEILPEADEIVIARGALGNAVPLWELPAAQKKIAASCRAAQKPFMVVTQMLASMEHSPVPTRAEVSDIFNAVLDGASSVMVTGETAVGEYPVNVILYLAETVNAANCYKRNSLRSLPSELLNK